MRIRTVVALMGATLMVLGISESLNAQQFNDQECVNYGPGCENLPCVSAGGPNSTCTSNVTGQPVSYNYISVTTPYVGTCMTSPGNNCCDFGEYCVTNYYALVMGQTCAGEDPCCNPAQTLVDGCS